MLFICNCKNNRLDVSVDEEAYKPNIVRLDERIWNLKEADFFKFTDSLKRADPNFFYGWVSQIVLSQYPEMPQPLVLDSLKHLLFNNSRMQYLKKEVHEKFKDSKEIDQAAAQVYSRFKHYFPKATLPVLITVENDMRAYGGVFEKAICISLDYFLGAEHAIYKSLPDLPKYIYQKFTPQYFGKRIADALHRFTFGEQDESPLFMQRMILSGMQEYYTDAMIPKEHDSIRRLYSGVQIKWLEKNEKQVWEHFASQKLFYSNEKEKTERYFVDGPFTQGLPQESAPRLGSWVGYKIVKKYMDTHENVTLEMLMKEKNYNKIFKESGYKP
ncbi:MAG: hypothetical protein SGJ10_04740 [Bacteroidota bacterium]|nr:hypothetical protein [Bacteroidota bacterium]